MLFLKTPKLSVELEMFVLDNEASCTLKETESNFSLVRFRFA